MLTTIDRFVAENALPRLAICTYHLPDDPHVLEGLIRESNPRYNVVHKGGKLFAEVSRN
ncbi:MAG: hypothetical protein LBR38_05220 [Synergistaceae bacterium]|jgi:hypothetical protein|nr:hypothetical protein [Synergistaceae bacterium]